MARDVRVTLSLIASGYEAGMAKAKASTDALIGSVEKNQAAAATMSTAMVGAGAAILAGVGATAKAAIDWESQFAGVKKTVDGTSAQIQALEGDLRGMARTMATSHEEIAATAEAAGQLGVRTEDVASFTRTMIMLGETTNLTADEAATSIAQISNIMGTASGDVDRFAATLVHLGNNGASTEAEILNLANRIAGAAKIVGVSEQNVLALSNAMASVGINAELGGSAMSRALIGMNTAVLDGGEKLEAFASVAGMSATKFSEAWKNDPITAVQAFVSGLSRINDEGGNAAQALADVGLKGTQNTQVFLALAGAHELLGQSIEQGAEAWAAGEAHLDEYGKRAETAAFKIQVAWNNITDAAITAGGALAPIVGDAATGFAKLVQVVSAIPAPIQGAMVGIAGVAGAALLAGGTAMKAFAAVSELKGALTTLGIIGEGTSGKLGGLSGSIKGIGVAAGAAAAILAGLGAALSAQNDAMDKLAPAAERVRGALLDLAGGQGGDAINETFATSAGYAKNLGEALAFVERQSGASADGMSQFGEGLMGFVANIIPGARSGAEIIAESLGRIDAQLAGMSTEQAAAAFAELSTQWDSTKISAEALVAAFPAYAESLQAIANETGVGVLTTQQLADAMMGDLPPAMKAAKGGSEELSAALLEQVAIYGRLGDGMEFTNEQFSKLAEGAGGLMQAYAGMSSGVVKMEDAIDKAAAAAAKYGQTLDLNTEAGRANQSALDSLIGSIGKQVEELGKAGASQAVVNATMTRGRDEYIKSAMAMGVSAEKARELADEMGLIPNQVVTLFTTPGADVSKRQAADMEAAVKKIPSLATTSILAPNARPSKADVDAFVSSVKNVPGLTTAEIRTVANLYGVEQAKRAIEGVQGKTVQVVVNYRSTGVSQSRVASAYASGGPIVGPGTGTSDSILALVSNGEYVIRSASVAKLGPERLDWLNRFGELPRFATGGQVASAPVRYAPNYSPPSYASSVAQAAQPVTVQMPSVMELRDVDGALIGRMRVEARGAVHESISTGRGRR